MGIGPDLEQTHDNKYKQPAHSEAGAVCISRSDYLLGFNCEQLGRRTLYTEVPPDERR